MSSALWNGPLAEEQRRLHLRAAAEYEELFRLYLKGRLDEAAFKRRRGYYGVHAQRSTGRVMLRLKTPLGRLSAAHLRLMADLARRYTPSRYLHATTRQNLQFYEVALEDSPDFLREAAEGGFGVAGAGGRNPRNLTLPAGCGLGPEEAFDPSWVAALMRLRLESDEALRGLPGKVKIGFWRSLHDEEAEPGNDITVVPVRRQVGTRLRRGFRLLLGGGLGASPRVEALWKSFVLPQDLYAHLRAVLLHFKVAGNPQAPENRLRHLVRREGWPSFQLAVDTLLLQQPRDRAATFFHRLPGPVGPAAAQLPAWMLGGAPPKGGQRYVVKGQLLVGMLSADQADALAELVQQGDGQLRLSTRQQVWLAGIPAARLSEVQSALAALGLSGPFLGMLSACPGGKLCANAGVETDAVSRLVLDALHKALGSVEGPATQGLKLGISGCGTGCGHHRSADLGLEGLRRMQDGVELPFVRVYARRPEDPSGLSEPLGSLPQASLPLLLQRWVADFRQAQAPDLASYLRQDLGYQSLRQRLLELAPADES